MTPDVGSDEPTGRLLEVAVPLRWSDQDRNGHVNNALIVTLLEESRVRWRVAGIAEGGLDASMTALIVVSLTVTFRKPVVYGSGVSIEVGVLTVGGRSVTLSHVGRQSGVVVFEATSVVVITGAYGTRPLTESERNYLAGWLADSSWREKM